MKRQLSDVINEQRIAELKKTETDNNVQYILKEKVAEGAVETKKDVDINGEVMHVRQ